MISFWILLEGSENGQMARAWRWCLLRLPPSRSTLEIHAKPPWEIWKNFSTGHGHVRSIGESSSHREVVFGGEIPESLHFVLTRRLGELASSAFADGCSTRTRRSQRSLMRPNPQVVPPCHTLSRNVSR